MSKKSKKSKDKSGGMGKSRIVLMLSLCLPLAFFLKSTFIFIVFGMMPTLVAYYVDNKKEKLLFRIVCMCNVAGVMPYATRLVMQNGSSESFQHYFLDIKVWFIMYASSGLGWVMVKYLPNIVQSILELNNHQRVGSIEKLNRQLVEEWGPDIQRTE